MFRRSFRFNSAAYMIEHLRYLKERFGIRHVNFYDDQFTFNRQRVSEFCSRMVDEKLEMTFNCAVRAEHIDLELLHEMKSAGCWMARITSYNVCYTKLLRMIGMASPVDGILRLMMPAGPALVGVPAAMSPPAASAAFMK